MIRGTCMCQLMHSPPKSLQPNAPLSSNGTRPGRVARRQPLALILGIEGEAPRLKQPPPALPGEVETLSSLDTSYLCVVDSKGNVFSATPSDGSYNSPVVPGLGFVPSTRGIQNWADEGHPSEIAPYRRPRLTPNPALAIQGGKFMPFGTPGGDVQTQAMLQTLLNLVVWGMGAQEAVEAPRFASYSFPSSFEPHPEYPGLLRLEGRMDKATGDQLAALGHKVEWWPDMTWLAGSMGLIVDDRDSGFKNAAADPPPHGLCRRRLNSAHKKGEHWLGQCSPFSSL